MILPVYLYGQPVLRKEAEEVPMDYPDLKQLVANMFETMYNADGVGLAAPQVGLSLRLLVIDADVMGDDFPECKGFKRAMINPVFLEKSEEEVSMEEGCLSLPGVHEKVARSAKVRVKYLDEDLKEHEETVEGSMAEYGDTYEPSSRKACSSVSQSLYDVISALLSFLPLSSDQMRISGLHCAVYKSIITQFASGRYTELAEQ